MVTLDEILKPSELEKLKKAAHPNFLKPMLATLTEDYFDDPTWIYERKLDGVRCLVSIKNGKVRLYSRNANEMTNSYFELPKILRESGYKNLIADGEIVAFEGKTTSFSKLQGRIQLQDKEKLQNTKIKIHLYLFDILYYDSYLLGDLPLRIRKKILKKVIDWNNNIRYTTHRNAKGKEFLEKACNKGWEGVIAKDALGTYVNSRSRKWLKFKCSLGQELVIGGFTEPQGEREGFGAMLVGFYKDGNLHYAGKVGTGFNDSFLQKWRSEFNKLTQKESPFKNFKDTAGGRNHWIKPKYVGQFGFTEWTKNNKLRHPTFLGMRNDKNPLEVVKETSLE